MVVDRSLRYAKHVRYVMDGWMEEGVRAMLMFVLMLAWKKLVFQILTPPHPSTNMPGRT